MLDYLGRRWSLIALRGALAILFGVLALAWPGITLLALVILWGAYTLVGGVTELALAFSRHEQANGERWLPSILGVIGIVAGIAALVWPGITAVILLLIIACWAVVAGVVQVATAIRLRRVVRNEWLGILAGALSVLLGVLLLARPGAGAVGLVYLIAIFALLWGITLVLFALRLRALHRGGGQSRRMTEQTA